MATAGVHSAIIGSAAFDHCCLSDALTVCPAARVHETEGRLNPTEAAPTRRDVAALPVPNLPNQYKELRSGAPEAMATVFLPGHHCRTSTREGARQRKDKHICNAKVVASRDAADTSPRFRRSDCLFPVRGADFADLASTPRYPAESSDTRRPQSSPWSSRRRSTPEPNAAIEDAHQRETPIARWTSDSCLSATPRAVAAATWKSAVATGRLAVPSDCSPSAVAQQSSPNHGFCRASLARAHLFSAATHATPNRESSPVRLWPSQQTARSHAPRHPSVATASVAIEQVNVAVRQRVRGAGARFGGRAARSRGVRARITRVSACGCRTSTLPEGVNA